jgi:uncharacterized repeat protein (TIGR01451 family)
LRKANIDGAGTRNDYGSKVRSLFTVVLVVSALSLLGPAAASAADITFGSDLSHAADTIAFRRGWDQNTWNTAAPPGIVLQAPQPGLIKEIRLRGFSIGRPINIAFRVIRKLPDGSWLPVSTPVTVPEVGSVNAVLPTEDGVHVYNSWDPRTFRVQAGDYVGVFNYGGGGAGYVWQIFSRQPDWTSQEISINDGFKDGQVVPDRGVNSEGYAVGNSHNEVLLQAVESPDLCPDTDLPQERCQSKLYLGGRVHKRGSVLNYTWTIRNGGPHKAFNLALRVMLPNGTTVAPATLPQSCVVEAGPPLDVLCQLSDLNSPQVGSALARLSFAVTPAKVTRFFRAVAQIEAPDVVDPQGSSKHAKTVSASTRYLTVHPKANR